MSATISAQEIKEIRTMYGLSQKSFATLLGIGPASMVRYEHGTVPSKANANLIRAARHPEFMLECLERDGDLIPSLQNERARQCVYSFISLDDEDEAVPAAASARKPTTYGQDAKEARQPAMDEVYHYTIQQEVLNEQAANLSCELMEYLIAAKINLNDQSNPVAILLRQLLELKRQLLTEEADDDVTLEQIRGHFKYISLFAIELTASEEVA